MIPRLELLVGVGVVLAAVAAIVATLFLPIATTGLSVDGGTPVIHALYARDNGLSHLVEAIAINAVFATCILLGAYHHSQHGSAFGRTIVLAALSFVLLTFWSLPASAFAECPALLGLLCALFALLPAKQHPVTEAHASR